VSVYIIATSGDESKVKLTSLLALVWGRHWEVEKEKPMPKVCSKNLKMQSFANNTNKFFCWHSAHIKVR
jgi:hypothetical protein